MCVPPQLEDVRIPGEVEEASGPLGAHEVVSQVEVSDVLTVKEVFRHRFQTVAGQVNQANCLGHHLHTEKP